jgi:hypothetical protein
MNASQFGAALEAYQAGQYARYQRQVDEDDLFDMEVEREMRRLGSMPLDDALEELGIEWDTTLTTLKGRLEDVVSSRTNDDY